MTLLLGDYIDTAVIAAVLALNATIKRAIDEANYAHSQQLIQEAEAVKRVIEQVARIKDGSPLDPTSMPARPPVSRTVRHKRVVGAFPQKAYQVPILEALMELGGQAHVSKVLERVYEKVKHNLTPQDLQTLPSGEDVRWRNTTKWARADLKEQGYLAADSPKGIWEITDAGRGYLESLKGGEHGLQ